jgi:large subunit ribosomal protein L24
MKNAVKCHIKKGDTVTVIAGDDKGKSGKVLQIVPQSGRALVEGVNFVKKHMRKSDEHPQGGVVEMEAGIAISNLKVSE